MTIKQTFKALLWVILLTQSSLAAAQDFTQVDAAARKVKSKNDDPVALAKALSANCKTETEKVRSFYIWITDNIKYDVATFKNRKDIDIEDRLELQTPTVVLRRKKAVCQGYAQLMDKMCHTVGIQSVVAAGLSKNAAGRVSRAGHAWNLVRADGQWRLLDCTWGAGVVDIDEMKYIEKYNEAWFFTASEEMLRNHLPRDPLYQLVSNPITTATFKEAKAKYVPTNEPAPGYAHLTDSLNRYIELDSLNRDYTTSLRLSQLEPLNNYGIYLRAKVPFQKGRYKHKQFYANSEANQKKPITKDWCDTQLTILRATVEYYKLAIRITDEAREEDQERRAVRFLSKSLDANMNKVTDEMKDMEALKKRL